MAVEFSVDGNGRQVTFSFDQKQGTIAIVAIDSQSCAIICQTKPCSDLETAMEQAMLLVNNRQNKLFWHPV
jgi:hypothetical protein